MDLGVCYFPEQWDESTWAPDARRMRELGLRWVRIGEFAWSVLEPSPGDLRFDWLDRAIATLEREGLEVVLCTPTATPPKWLVDRRPDILPVDAEGRARRFGSRRHYCFNSRSYREETSRIVTLLGERYGKHPAVRAWQLDNEYGCHDTVSCYCDACARDFRVWLEGRYGTVDALNEAWWTTFWSQRYRSFDEIDLPNLTVTEPNPSHRLDYLRFASDSVLAYNRLQVETLRPLSPGRPLTHNVMAYFGGFDHHALARDLDVLTWDNYPLGMLEVSSLPAAIKERYARIGHPDLIGFVHDLYHGAKDAPFWVMEQQPGQVNWAPSNPLPVPGAVRLWTHQAFAHGAEVVSYFRWRAALGAQELMHAGLNLHDGRPDRASREAAQVAGELLEVDTGATRRPVVAQVVRYEDLWATGLQPHAQGWDYWALQLSYYSALRSLGIDVDVVPAGRDLSPYRLVLAPALHLVDDDLAEWLEGYVRGGGRLLLGPRSGAKTPSNVAQAPAPGPLARLSGVRIERVDALRPGLEAELHWQGRAWRYHTWADVIEPLEAEVLARYRTDAYPDAAALSRHRVGSGECLTLGAWGADEFHRALLQSLLEDLAVPCRHMPEGVRLQRRAGRGVLMNFGPRTADVSGLDLTREGQLPPYGLLFLGEAGGSAAGTPFGGSGSEGAGEA